MPWHFQGTKGWSVVRTLRPAHFSTLRCSYFLLFGSKILLLPTLCPFHVSWWSVSFPLASVTIACFRYSKWQPDIVHRILAGALLAVTTVVILYLIVLTLIQIAHYGRATNTSIAKGALGHAASGDL
ncbi:hypothetical protein ACQ86N_15110 [Puia sp. P3]|uniref:SLAC1 family transporter n=1 Tax=Puia sp. P3 TaxID=3423952 RepID=UPI003D669AD1